MPKGVRFWLEKKDEFENAEGEEITERWRNSEKIQPAAGRPKKRVKRVKALIREETSAWLKEAIRAEGGDPTPEVTTLRDASLVGNAPAGTTNHWGGRLRKPLREPPEERKKPPARRRKNNANGAAASAPPPRARSRRGRGERSRNPRAPIPLASPSPPPPPPPQQQQPDNAARTSGNPERAPSPASQRQRQHNVPNSPRYSLSPSPPSSATQRTPSSTPPGCRRQVHPTSPPIPSTPDFDLELDHDFGSEPRGSEADAGREERGYWVMEERRDVRVRAKRAGDEMASPRVGKRSRTF